MNKFAEWIQNNDKKQVGVAEKLGICASTLHDILRKGQMPSLRLAYEIEKYTRGAVTLYDWIDQAPDAASDTTKTATKTKIKKAEA